MRHKTESQEQTRTDLELIDAINGGDDEAFEALYWRYRDWVVNLAMRFTGDSDAALDVMQETFLYFLRKCPGFRLTCQFKTFLYTPVRNLSAAAREKAKRFHTSTDEIHEYSLDAAAPCGDDSNEHLRHVLAGLPEEQREVILLRFVDDLSLAEIAGAMEIPLGTVKSRLHNALETLRNDVRTRSFFEK